MSNVQWRKFRLEAFALIELMRQQSISSDFENELKRIIALLDHEDEINSYPKVYLEANPIESFKLPKKVVELYSELLDKSKRFRVFKTDL